jgi:Tfp pilus assembly protein PilF
MGLNPNHPAWYWFPVFFDLYRQRDYASAARVAEKITLPGYFFKYAALAAAYGQLGHLVPARAALRQLLELKPDARTLQREYQKWLYEPDQVDHIVDGLRKAGLATASDNGQHIA